MEKIKETKDVSGGTATRDYYNSHCGKEISTSELDNYICTKVVAMPSKWDAFWGDEYYIGNYFGKTVKKGLLSDSYTFVLNRIDETTDSSCNRSHVELDDGDYTLYLYK